MGAPALTASPQKKTASPKGASQAASTVGHSGVSDPEDALSAAHLEGCVSADACLEAALLYIWIYALTLPEYSHP